MQSYARLLVETDVFGDVDDVGALAVAHHLADVGRCEIIAIGVNTPSRFGSQTVRVVNRWYGRPGIPVGGLLPLDDSVFELDYAKTIAETHATEGERAEPLPAVQVHRRALGESDDGSVTVVSLGFLNNLRDLLESAPDEHSPLDGRELVGRKVRRAVVMGGYFPTGHEYNITEDIPAAQAFVETWPTPVDFLGWEVGAPVVTGKRISTQDGVIGDAYRAYNGAGTGRESWDLLAMHAAITDDPELYRSSAPGTVEIDATGRTTFHAVAGGAHRFISLACPPEVAAAALDRILDAAPALAAH